jgi:hypothetical protein
MLGLDAYAFLWIDFLKLVLFLRDLASVGEIRFYKRVRDHFQIMCPFGK